MTKAYDGIGRDESKCVVPGPLQDMGITPGKCYWADEVDAAGYEYAADGKRIAIPPNPHQHIIDLLTSCEGCGKAVYLVPPNVCCRACRGGMGDE